MKKPDPLPGQIIRYDYLWYDERKAGREEGTKERPCAVILHRVIEPGQPPYVLVAPITHTKPKDMNDAIEIPANTRKSTNLDARPSWLIKSEVNTVRWDDPGIVPASRDSWLVGHLTKSLTAKLIADMRQRIKNKSLSTVSRRL